VKPAVPTNTAAANVPAPAIKGSPAAVASGLASAYGIRLPRPKRARSSRKPRRDPGQSLHEITLTASRMYKAPSWSLIEEAREAGLPKTRSWQWHIQRINPDGSRRGAKRKRPLDAAAAGVEKSGCMGSTPTTQRLLSERQKRVVGRTTSRGVSVPRGRPTTTDWSGKGWWLFARAARTCFTVAGRMNLCRQ